METFITKLEDALSGYLGIVPDILKVLLVLFVGWIIARLIKRAIAGLMKKTSWDEKLLGNAIGGDTNKFLGKLGYYTIMIIVLLVALEMMGVSDVLDPVKGMMSEILGFIPNLLAAGVLGFIGYVLAKFISNLLSIGGNIVDRFVDKTGFKSTDKLVEILRQVVFLVILIPFIILALNALQLEAISGPANQILADILNIIPNILGAAAIIALFLIGGKFLAGFLRSLLESLGVDTAAEKLQLTSVMGEGQSLAKIISNIAFFFLAFFGIITGVELLELDQLSGILNRLLEVSGQILFGMFILVVGNYISKLIYNAMSKGEGNNFIASVIRVATLGLFLAMALRAMNIAPDIVNLAFALTLGSVAVVIALAYGLGGREAAGEHFREIIEKIKRK